MSEDNGAVSSTHNYAALEFQKMLEMSQFLLKNVFSEPEAELNVTLGANEEAALRGALNTPPLAADFLVIFLRG